MGLFAFRNPHLLGCRFERCTQTPNNCLGCKKKTPIWGLSVELMGLEPTTSCMPCKHSSQLSYSPNSGCKHKTFCDFGARPSIG